MREFIDQGSWAISAIYTYLAATGDASLLSERVGYHRISPANQREVQPAGESDSVLEHLLRMTDYLSRQRDPETGLVLALYGDWNDALDGLGISSDPKTPFGSGVSVMTSLQLYRNCAEMIDIVSRFADGRHDDHLRRFRQLRDELRRGLLQYAVIRRGEERRIVHGWGDRRQYFVGSFCDSDGLARDGLTSNAFWVLSDMLDEDPSLKSDVLAAFERLDSRYGLRTFEPGFAPDSPGVGRITKLPLGTAENGAVYVHATTFAIAALFRLGEPERAWQQIAKILPFAPHHTQLSHSPFVMPNSYVENSALNLTGQSMNDWQTGCSNVLLKLLIRYVFGFEPTFDHLWIDPAAWIPFDTFEFCATVHNRRLRVEYRRGKVAQRSFELDGNRLAADTISKVSGAVVAIVPYSSLSTDGVNEIVVTDPDCH